MTDILTHTQDYFFNSTRLKFIPTSDRDVWLQARTELAKTRLGGSDISTLMGKNSFNAPIKLFYEKIGYIQPTPVRNIQATYGRWMESAVKNLWQFWDDDMDTFLHNEENGILTRTYEDVDGILLNDAYKHLLASIDGKITHHPMFSNIHGILEAKTMGYNIGISYEEEGKGLEAHILQVHCYMIVTGAPYAEIVAMKDNNRMDVYLVQFNENIAQAIIYTSEEFISNVVKGKEMMNQLPRGHELDEELHSLEPKLIGIYNETKFINEQLSTEVDRAEWVEMDVTPEVLDLVEKRYPINRQLGILEKEKYTLENQIRNELRVLGANRMIIDRFKKHHVSYSSKLIIRYEPQGNQEEEG